MKRYYLVSILVLCFLVSLAYAGTLQEKHKAVIGVISGGGAACPGEDFTDASGDQPISWWYFESASTPSVDSSANGNSLAWVSAAQDTTDKKQGTGHLGPARKSPSFSPR